MYDGMINVYKEKNYTSHDVVAKLRGILRQKKIGHTGTLDPDATGVLPVCLGKGTKLCDMITDHDKTYQVTFCLGYITDTQDMTGTVLEQHPVTVTEEALMDIILSFVGEYDQIPPMYSAIKVNGQKLYQLARAGIEVERKARRITIHSITDIAIDLPYVTMTVGCSKGTYIRTLCHDIGMKAGCGAAMSNLMRTKVGQFDLSSALTLSEIEEKVKTGAEKISSAIIPLDVMLSHMPAVKIADDYGQKLLMNGNKLALSQICPDTSLLNALPELRLLKDGQEVRVYDRARTLIAVYAYHENSKDLKNIKMFL